MELKREAKWAGESATAPPALLAWSKALRTPDAIVAAAPLVSNARPLRITPERESSGEGDYLSSLRPVFTLIEHPILRVARR